MQQLHSPCCHKKRDCILRQAVMEKLQLKTKKYNKKKPKLNCQGNDLGRKLTEQAIFIMACNFKSILFKVFIGFFNLYCVKDNFSLH